MVLRGWLVPPEGAARAGVVFAHGRSGGKHSHLDLLPAVRQRGYCSLLYDTRGHGASESGGPGDGFAGGDRDIIAAAQLLRERCHVSKVGVVGISQGASNAIIAAAESPSIDAVVAISAGTNLYDLLRAVPSLERRSDWVIALATRLALYRLDAPWERIANLEQGPLTVVDRIAPRGLMLIHGSDDPLIPVEQAGRMYVRAKQPKRLWIVRGGGHAELRELTKERYDRYILAFLGEHLLSA